MMGSSNLYDLATIKEYVGNNEEQVLEIIMIFLNDVPEMLNKLFEGNDISDFEQLHFYSHKLKSSIDLFKISELQDEIRKLESNAKMKINTGDIPGQLTQISKVLNNVITQIKEDFRL